MCSTSSSFMNKLLLVRLHCLFTLIWEDIKDQSRALKDDLISMIKMKTTTCLCWRTWLHTELTDVMLSVHTHIPQQTELMTADAHCDVTLTIKVQHLLPDRLSNVVDSYLPVCENSRIKVWTDLSCLSHFTWVYWAAAWGTTCDALQTLTGVFICSPDVGWKLAEVPVSCRKMSFLNKSPWWQEVINWHHLTSVCVCLCVQSEFQN